MWCNARASPASEWIAFASISPRSSRWEWTSRTTRRCEGWRRRAFKVLGDAPLERRAALLEMSAFAEFLVEQMPKLREEWEARRRALAASGDLPEERPGQRRTP